MYTTSSVFLKTLIDYGITHAFVNWGSDHPALLEDLARQRSENSASYSTTSSSSESLKIITCPNEMVALSAAHGFAQATGNTRMAAVLIHVDVGTQALAGAIHNADRGRVPVFIYAGAAPFTTHGELKGSRNEWIMWLQDVPDQSAIVRQYMRYTGEIRSGKNVNKTVLRALQYASSEPKGPVYIWARREAMEEEIDETAMIVSPKINHWAPTEPGALSVSSLGRISAALLAAKSPLIVTSYVGRNPRAVPKLVALSEALGIPVFVSCPVSVNMPFSHSNFVDMSFGMGSNDWIQKADVILIIDSDVPYIPIHNKPREDARVFHIDVDVLKANINVFHVDAELRCQADAEVALTQLLECIPATATNSLLHRVRILEEGHKERIRAMDAIEQEFPQDGSFTVPNLISILRKTIPEKTLMLAETPSDYPYVWKHLRAERPGCMLSSGSSALGWGLGAAIGASLGDAGNEEGERNELIALVVGDGSYLFGVPSSAFWIARKYKTPFLTIVINNGGWKSPKLSMLGVYPSGIGSVARGEELTVGFGPETPDYSQIAVAAGGAWGKRVQKLTELQGVISEAVRVVLEEKRCAVVDCVVESI